MAEENLDNVRERIRQIDLELIAHAAERSRLVKQVGEIKRRKNIATVDYSQERAVLERARVAAEQHGLDPNVAQDLLARLIHASVTAQDQESLRFSAAGVGKSAVIVGGAGRMGKWMSRFLSAQGFQVGSLDPSGTTEENQWSRDALHGADFVVCSTPPAATAQLYASWIAHPPKGIVVDIASIKTPLIEPIRMLQKAGVRVA